MSSGGASRPPQTSGPADLDRLELAVRELLDEHGRWQRRAKEAEAQARELETALDEVTSGDLDPIALSRKAEELERDNRELRERLGRAHGNIRRILDRLNFLEEER